MTTEIDLVGENKSCRRTHIFLNESKVKFLHKKQDTIRKKYCQEPEKKQCKCIHANVTLSLCTQLCAFWMTLPISPSVVYVLS